MFKLTILQARYIINNKFSQFIINNGTIFCKYANKQRYMCLFCLCKYDLTNNRSNESCFINNENLYKELQYIIENNPEELL